MGKVVIISLEASDPTQPFLVRLDMGEDDPRGQIFTLKGLRGTLPSAHPVLTCYDEWQQHYYNLEAHYRRSRLTLVDREPELNRASPEAIAENLSQCRAAADRLRHSLNAWLKADEFRLIERKLLRSLAPADQVQVVIQTSDPNLRRLPWETWEFFDEFPQAALALSPLEHLQAPPPAPERRGDRVRILAILGNSDGINVEPDRTLLEQLPDAEVCVLVEPQRSQLEQLWQQAWDILFFAGHSISHTDGKTGYITINRHEQLSLTELQNTLKRSAQNGLRLAIFNSCDGLGLARALENTGISQVIVMREPIPDQAAQDFLTYFLNAFANGQSAPTAVREAREKLHDLSGIESHYPGTSGLPMLFQLTIAPVSWQQFLPDPRPPSAPQPWEWLLRHQRSLLLASSAIGLLLAVGTAAWLGSPICSFTSPRAKALIPIPEGLFNYGGSLAWSPMSPVVQSAIESTLPQFGLRYLSSAGSSEGIQLVLSGQLSFAQSTRPLTGEELQAAQAQNFELAQRNVAIEAIAVAVHPQLQIPGLTLADLQDIYTGKLRNWNQLGGPDLSITPYSRPPETGGTTWFFIEAVLHNQPFDPRVVQFVGSTSEGISRLSLDPGGLYYASATEIVPQCHLRALPIGHQPGEYIPPYEGNFIPPEQCWQQRNQINQAAFGDRTYPLSRNLLVIYKDFPGRHNQEEQAGRAYAKLLLTDQGQRLIEQVGLVPLRVKTCHPNSQS